LQTAPGEYQKKSYLQGLRYNDVIAARQAQAAMGWAAALETRTRADGVFELTVVMKDAKGASLDGLSLSGNLRRPAQSERDHGLEFKSVGEGTYRARLSGIENGQWRLDFAAIGGEAPFHAEKTLWVR
jgi:nitrogen fixation protein FixH